MAWNLNVPDRQVKIDTRIPHIAVCIPHYGNISMEWADKMYGPLRFMPQPDMAITVRMARGILNLDTERNVLVNIALKEKSVTHLLFVDTDVIIEQPNNVHDAIRALLRCNGFIASGMYRPWLHTASSPVSQRTLPLPAPAAPLFLRAC